MEGAHHPAESDKLIYCAVEGEEHQVVGHISLSIQREAALFGENYTDCIQLSILDREWRARKA
ncbi:hypothetical protein [Paenibacillus riograndensis]|uniref:hypothetical protein n=1 Tax=Paenibacillus riograndensis TaxID=483937 RepID=UPI0002EC1621|nr:hypothetical protein [Paenibacillus riograndensis]